MPEWHTHVRRARAELGIDDSSRSTIQEKLAELGAEAVVNCLRRAYRDLVRRTGVAERYEAYFAACVVSDFGDPTAPHELPVWLQTWIWRQQEKENPLPPGTLRIRFRHLGTAERAGAPGESNRIVLPAGLMDRLAQSPSSEWVECPLPFGVEVLWPYEVPLLSLNEAALREIREDIRLKGISMGWFVLQQFTVVHKNRWLILPLRLGHFDFPMTLDRLYDLPSDSILGARAGNGVSLCGTARVVGGDRAVRG